MYWVNNQVILVFRPGKFEPVYEPSDKQNTRRKSSFATAILLQRWQMRARSKAHDPLHRSAWSAADRPANNVANMAASLAPSNLRRDSKAPGRAK